MTILIAIALVVILVVGVVGLAVSSPFDGTTDTDNSQGGVEVVEEDLQTALDEEEDILNPDYDPDADADSDTSSTFTTDGSSGQEPSNEEPSELSAVDYEAVERVLQDEFTEGQVSQAKELMGAVAQQQTGTGTVTTLTPVEDGITPGTLVRLGNNGPYTWDATGETLVENANFVRDVEITLETSTLPYTQANATLITAGSWEMEAWQDSASDTVYYEIDDYDSGRTQTATGSSVTFAFHNDTINGNPAIEPLEFAPGESSYDVSIQNQFASPTVPGASPTAGGVNLLAVDGTPDDVPTDQYTDVVHNATFDIEAVDEDVTYTDRVQVVPDYTAYEIEESGVVSDPVTGIRTEISPSTFRGEEAIIVGNNAEVTTYVQFRNGTEKKITSDSSYSIVRHSGSSTLSRSVPGMAAALTGDSPTPDGDPLTLRTEYTYDSETYTDTSTVQVIDPVVNDFNVDIADNRISTGGTTGLSATLTYGYSHSSRTGTFTETVSDDASYTVQTASTLRLNTGVGVPDVEGKSAGDGEVKGTIDESEILGVDGGTYADTDDVVVETSNFAVSIQSTNSPIEEGSGTPGEVTVQVTNTGNMVDTQDIDLRVAPDSLYYTTATRTDVTLNGGDSTTFSLAWNEASENPGTNNIRVRSDDDTARGSLVVEADSGGGTDPEPSPEPNFNVEIKSTNSILKYGSGNAGEVVAEITNTGGDGTQDVTLSKDSWGSSQNPLDSQSVSLNADESQTVTFTWSDADQNLGQHTLTVSSDDDSDSTQFEVAQPQIDVTITNTNSPLEIGNGLTALVTVQVENNGPVAATDPVALQYDGGTVSTGPTTPGQIDSTGPRTLTAGETTTTVLRWYDVPSKVGQHTLTATYGTSSDSTTIDVNDPGIFDVEIIKTNSPIQKGSGTPAVVDARITNTRNETQETQTIVLDDANRYGTDYDEQSLTLDGGESKVIQLQWDTVPGYVNDYTLRVQSEDDSDTAPLNVVDKNLAYNIINTNSPITTESGKPAKVTFEVVNNNKVDITETWTFTDEPDPVGGSTDVFASGDVEVEAGGSQTLTVEWPAAYQYPGTHTLEVEGEANSDTTKFEVNEPANFDVEIQSVDSPRLEGSDGDVPVVVEITNTGMLYDTQQISLDYQVGRSSSGTTDNEYVSLSGGETTSIIMYWDEADDPTAVVGTHSVRAESEDDIDTGNLVVEEASANFQVGIINTNGPLTYNSGTPGEVTANIENIGNGDGEQQVGLYRKGETEPITSQRINLDGSLSDGRGSATTTTFEWDSATNNVGTHDLVVKSEDDSDDTQLEVENYEPDPQEDVTARLSLVAPWEGTSLSEGQTYTFSARVSEKFSMEYQQAYPEVEPGSVNADRSDFTAWETGDTGVSNEGTFTFVDWNTIKITSAGDGISGTEIYNDDTRYDLSHLPKMSSQDYPLPLTDDPLQFRIEENRDDNPPPTCPGSGGGGWSPGQSQESGGEVSPDLRICP